MDEDVQQQQHQEQVKHAGGRLRRIIRALAAVTIIGVCAVLATAWFGYSQSLPVEETGKPVSVKVEPGSGTRDIADQLERQGLIRSSDLFLLYLKWHGEGSRFQAGAYEIRPGITFAQIVDKLNRGEVVQEETVRLTVPEGYTVMQIIELLEEHGYNRDQLLKLAHSHPPAVKSASAAAIPADTKLRIPLEGYLFPETYEFKKGTTEQEVLDAMAVELDRKLTQLPEGWRMRLEALNITFHQFLTLASLIEREVAVASERALVSGVMYNRLRMKMPLQIDATIQYLFDKPKELLYNKDLQIESPYNTYLNAGIPPGPIASPSLAAMKAALYPAETKYLFYVTKKDGTNEHLFAETFEQHLRNIEISTKGQKGG